MKRLAFRYLLSCPCTLLYLFSVLTMHGSAFVPNMKLSSRVPFHDYFTFEPNSRKIVLAAAPSSSSSSMSQSFIHHTALRTRNITTAIQFYSLVGFEVDCCFRAGPARAAWMTLPVNATSSACRLEIIEVPSFILNEPQGMRRRAPDLMENEQELGWNHMALDVTQQILNDELCGDLAGWMAKLNQTSFERFGRSLRVALPPRQQMIGQSVYELAFIYDADGSLIEFLHKQGEVSQSMSSGWDPWDGTGFWGP